ncbi:MAG: hypothetical protein LBF41_06475 [Deltaproteobacteria bacterium]|jgi:N-methylhydantoinase A/oxoprolinase/acetone carboxylase beta subunit|nr:hypothetical protein [Deltaproteobacteria bacterium]
MNIGIDVGGTHTDAVLLDDGHSVVGTAKTLTRPEVAVSLSEVLASLLRDLPDRSPIKRVTVSTTLGLNSVLTGTGDPVGALVTTGPGMPFDPEPHGVPVRELSAKQDHRGVVLEPLKKGEALAAAKSLVGDDKVFALVIASKFGPKNPEIEEAIHGEALPVAPGPVTRASQLFGALNFPRRLNSAVLNAGVSRLYGGFLSDSEKAAKDLGLSGAELLVLKSDGGVMSLGEAAFKPVDALAAGPAASLLGLWFLFRDETDKDILMVDMGGTSTDLALLTGGLPLMIPEGLKIAGKNTLVRGLLTSSVALGGDTDLVYGGGRFVAEARRRGLALALDPSGLETRPPTLTDALNVLGKAKVGDAAVSVASFERLGEDPAALAKLALDAVMTRLADAVEAFLADVNVRPVYTVNDFLVDRKLVPGKVVFLGGPAASLAAVAEDWLKLPCASPPEALYANALGAALARPTFEAELYADTALGVLSIPTLGVSRRIGREYNLDTAKKELLEALRGREGARITLAESFNQLMDRGQTGRIIKVRAQGSPGLLA